MSILFSAGAVIATTLGVVYASIKGWHAFHRAVGITPGTLEYVPPSSEPELPNLLQLNIDKSVLPLLPPSVLSQLSRIDNKADIYQQWRDALTQQGHTVAANEAQFVVRKLLSERIPAMLSDYQTLAQHQQRIADMDSANDQNLDSALPALTLLTELLDLTESRLDILLDQCRDSSYQELVIMKRYLDKLDDGM